MEDTDEDQWEKNNYKTKEEDEEENIPSENNKVVKLLTKGVKGIVVTGCVISSAPLLLPPFLVTSAMGFALSLPYAFFLATYTSTQSLMSMLLPPSPTTTTTPQFYADRDDSDGDVIVDGNEKSLREERPLFDEEEEEEEEVVTELLTDQISEEEGKDNENEQQFVAETTGLIEKVRDDSGCDTRGDDYIPSNYAERGGADGKVDNGMQLQEGREVQEAEKRETQNVDTSQEHDAFYGDIVVSASFEVTMAAADTDAKRAETPSGSMASDEVVVLKNEEEATWKTINAVRAILGYRGNREATCMEEVKALYLFTGVEPPASFNNSSDLLEVNEKLKSLMVIVGIK